MPLDKETIKQIVHLLRPLSTRQANMIARGVVQLVDDGKKLQLVQLGVLDGETVEGANPSGAEHFQQYGFSSIPLAGAEAIVIFPNGDRAHPLVIATGDRSNRPTGGDPGDVVMYNAAGAKITLTKDGDIKVQPAPGKHVVIGGVAADSLVTKTEFNAHVHATAGNGPPSIPTTPAVGTTVLKGE